MFGYHENITIAVHNPSHDWIQCIFWCPLIKFTNFAFDDNAVLWSETTCLDGWVEGFLNMELSQHSTKVGVQVQCISLNKSNNFAFDNESA